MEDIEGARELYNSFLEDPISETESTISEKEVHLYSLVYHVEHAQPTKISQPKEISDSASRESEFHVSARSKAFRLNEVSTFTRAPSDEHRLDSSKSVRNNIKKITAKVDSMRQNNTGETYKHTPSKSDSRAKKHAKGRKNGNWNKGSNGGTWAVKGPQVVNPKKNVAHVNEATVCTSGMCDNETLETARPDVIEISIEKDAEISKYDMSLNENNVESSESVILIDSDGDSVESIIEVKPPTPPPPVVISIDSSDEASQARHDKISTQKENIGSSSPSTCVEIEISTDSELVIEKQSPVGTTSSVTPSENNLIVSYDGGKLKPIPTPENSSITESVNNSDTPRKRKKKSESSKNKKSKSRSLVNRQNVPISWTSEMIKFYCQSWGGDKFDHEELQRQMSGNSSEWRVLDIDLRGPQPKVGPYRRSRCGNCNQIGHVFEQCPDPLKEMCCYMCGEKGHTKHTCPNKICLQCGRAASKFSAGCHKCFYDSRPCDSCGQYGHLMWLCPEAWRIYHSSTTQEIPTGIQYNLKTPNDQFCCNCARRGHTTYNCKLPNNQTQEKYTSDPTAQYNSAFKYKNQNHKHTSYRETFFSVNKNRNRKKHKNDSNVKFVNDSDPSTTFTHKKKKFSNADRKRMKKKQKKMLRKQRANLEQK